MATLSFDRREIHIGDDGVIAMAEPGNGRWNRYQAELVEVKGDQLRNNEGNAASRLFDDLVSDIRNITVRKDGREVEVTMDNFRELIPLREKTRLLYTFLAAGPKLGVDETKNSSGTFGVS